MALGFVTVQRTSKPHLLLCVVIAQVCCLPVASILADQTTENAFTEVNQQFENWQMSMLAKVQATPGNVLQPFTTDGCSGGMSDAWYFIAESIPAFASRLGDKPPWEACCVEHDRDYWRGETEAGFDKRLAADKKLQLCVAEFGRAHAPEFAKRYNMDISTIETNFSLAADLMYRAVRLGGKPCSFLPWRWGYGWPHCIPDITLTNE